jgi:hypothetical protein
MILCFPSTLYRVEFRIRMHSTTRVAHWTKVLFDLKRIRVWAGSWGSERKYDSRVLPMIIK